MKVHQTATAPTTANAVIAISNEGRTPLQRVEQRHRQSDHDWDSQREHHTAERTARDHREPRRDDEPVNERQANRVEFEA